MEMYNSVPVTYLSRENYFFYNSRRRPSSLFLSSHSFDSLNLSSSHRLCFNGARGASSSARVPCIPISIHSPNAPLKACVLLRRSLFLILSHTCACLDNNIINRLSPFDRQLNPSTTTSSLPQTPTNVLLQVIAATNFHTSASAPSFFRCHNLWSPKNMASSFRTPPFGDFTGSQRFQLTRDQFEEHGVWQAYEDYLQPGDAQDPNFENFYQLCLRFGKIPSLETINWIIREVNLIDPSRRLQFPVYAFLQEFKFDFHVAQDTDQPRMLVAHVHTDEGPCSIWACWSWADEGMSSKAKMKLYLEPHADELGSHEANIPEDHRVAFKWDEPFEVLFQLDKYEPIHVNVSIQDTILLSVAKVLTRFPSLANENRPHQ